LLNLGYHNTFALQFLFFFEQYQKIFHNILNMLLEQLVDDYRRMISGNILELYKRRQESMNLQEYDNKENINPKVKKEDKKERIIEDPEIEPLSW
jgi:hypothetical protein